MADKIPLEKIYGPGFFARRFKMNWRAVPFCQAVIETFGLKRGTTIIDVGCATGDFVHEYNNLQMVAFGLEGSECARPYLECDPNMVMTHDLRTKIDPKLRFDFCQCLEVAEHIEQEYADTFVDNLVSLAPIILVSAAGPGQGGHYHVNCRESSYWDDKFSERKYYRFGSDETTLRMKLNPYRNKPGILAYYHNMLVYRQG